MKRMLILAVAVTAMVFANSSDASAQSYNNGYGFGTGVNQSFGNQGRGFGGGFFSNGFGVGTISILDRANDAPYFAKFPPVYYSGIVRRPYGISPFAAPPGVAPVELSLPVVTNAHRVTVKNPFFNQEAQAVSAPKAAPTPNNKRVKLQQPSLENKMTRIVNPFFVAEPIVQVESVEVDSVLLASTEIEMPLIDAVELAFFN